MTASEACAREIIELPGGALAGQPRVCIAVSGGNAPKPMFAQMAKANLDWVDERLAPPTDSQSNDKLAKENFIHPAHFPSESVHRVPGELRPVHRGIGRDAHTASLFPGEPSIDNHRNLAGVTLLPAVLEAARHTLMLAAGEDQAERLDGEGVMWFLDKAAAGLIG
jgi:6-phosphogluconolactonase